MEQLISPNKSEWKFKPTKCLNIHQLLLMVQKSGDAPVEVGSLSHSWQGFIHPRWCRISFISRTCQEVIPKESSLPTIHFQVQAVSFRYNLHFLHKKMSSQTSTKNHPLYWPNVPGNAKKSRPNMVLQSAFRDTILPIGWKKHMLTFGTSTLPETNTAT